jgi:hypothetical protein
MAETPAHTNNPNNTTQSSTLPSLQDIIPYKHDVSICDLSSSAVEQLQSLEFHPETVGLPADFILYNYNKLKG